MVWRPSPSSLRRRSTPSSRRKPTRGTPADLIARRSVAFFLVKSAVNFVAVAVIGLLFVVGVIGPHQPFWRTGLPAILSVAVIVAVASIGKLGEPEPAPEDAERLHR